MSGRSANWSRALTGRDNSERKQPGILNNRVRSDAYTADSQPRGLLHVRAALRQRFEATPAERSVRARAVGKPPRRCSRLLMAPVRRTKQTELCSSPPRARCTRRFPRSSRLRRRERPQAEGGKADAGPPYASDALPARRVRLQRDDRGHRPAVAQQVSMDVLRWARPNVVNR